MTTPFLSLDPHPLSEIFPLNEEDIEAIASDMRENGYDWTQPIVTYERKILDGRNRYEAAKRAGVKPLTKSFNPERQGDPADYVLRTNLHRRHLTAGQKAAVASKLATLKEGRPEKTPPTGGVSIKQSAQAVGASERSVQRFRTIEKRDPEAAVEVASGRKSLGGAEADIRARAVEKQQRAALVAPRGGDGVVEDSWWSGLEHAQEQFCTLGGRRFTVEDILNMDTDQAELGQVARAMDADPRVVRLICCVRARVGRGASEEVLGFMAEAVRVRNLLHGNPDALSYLHCLVEDFFLRQKESPHP